METIRYEGPLLQLPAQADNHNQRHHPTHHITVGILRLAEGSKDKRLEIILNDSCFALVLKENVLTFPQPFPCLRLCLRGIKIHWRERNILIRLIDISKLGFEFLDVVRQSPHQSFSVLWSQHDPCLHFCFGNIWHHPDKVNYKFGM